MLNRCSSITATTSTVPEGTFDKLSSLYEACLSYGDALMWSHTYVFSYLYKRDFVEIIGEVDDVDGILFRVKLTADAIRFINKHPRQYDIPADIDFAELSDDLPF